MPFTFDDYNESEIDTPDYGDINEDLAKAINQRIENDEWRSNTKQQYYVVKTVERTLSKDHSSPVQRRRSRAQEEVLNETSLVDDKQTIQAACHVRLITEEDDPPTYQGETQWHKVFDEVIRSIDEERRSELPQ